MIIVGYKWTFVVVNFAFLFSCHKKSQYGPCNPKALWGDTLVSWVTNNNNKVVQGRNALCKEMTWWAMVSIAPRETWIGMSMWGNDANLDAIHKNVMP